MEYYFTSKAFSVLNERYTSNLVQFNSFGAFLTFHYVLAFYCLGRLYTGFKNVLFILRLI